MRRLDSADLQLEAVTPLWMGGCNYQPELRPPSMRGCMRFWLRALLGGVLGEDLADVRAAESAVFGSTVRASSVAVRMTGEPRTGPPPVAAEQFPGVGYMYWSMYQRNREAILPGEVFRLRLQTRPFSFAPVEVQGRQLGAVECFELAAAAAWLLLRLGGAGARARRTGGGMRVVGTPEGWPQRLPPPVSTATTTGGLAEELAQGIDRIRSLTGWQSGPPPDTASFNTLHPSVCQLYLIDRTFPGWWEAVDWAGQLFAAFRRECVEDASGVAALLTRGRTAIRTVRRAVLGLPIVFFFKSMLSDLTGQGIHPRDARRRASATVSPRRGLARASPLFFRVIRVPGETAAYAVLMGLFRSRLLPDDQMTIRPQDRAVAPVNLAAPADFSLVERWFEYVQQQQTPLLPIAFS